MCTADELAADVEVCFDQDIRLNLFFSIASTTANVSALPVGTLLDRYGPKLCLLLGCLCLTAGSVLMSLAFQIAEFDGYTIGNFFLALGGTFVFLPSFQIANAFPKSSGSIVALVTGAFDASAAVYLFYRLIYEASNGTFKPQTFFLVYLAVPFFVAIAQLTILPSEAYKTAPQLEMKIHRAEDNMRDVHSSDDELPDDEMWKRRKFRSNRRRQRLSQLDDLVGDAQWRKKQDEKLEQQQETSGVWGALHNKTAGEQMMTPWFILLTLLTVLQMVRMVRSPTLPCDQIFTDCPRTISLQRSRSNTFTCLDPPRPLPRSTNFSTGRSRLEASSAHLSWAHFSTMSALPAFF